MANTLYTQDITETPTELTAQKPASANFDALSSLGEALGIFINSKIKPTQEVSSEPAGVTTSSSSVGMSFTPDTKTGQPIAPSSSTGRVKETALKTLPVEARAFLDTLSLKESKGYDVIVGSGEYGAPASFSDYSKHPNIVGMVTEEGPSTAAGRYQIVYSTWVELRKQYPNILKDFSPTSQDMAAWLYAKDTYKRRTGRDLLTSLKEGDMSRIKRALKGQWIGFDLDQDAYINYLKEKNKYI